MTYTITTANSGPNAAENVVITDSIIARLTGVRASNNGTYDAVTGVVTFPTIPSLTSGSNTNCQVKLVVPATRTISHTILGDYGTQEGSTVATSFGDLIFGNDSGDIIGGCGGNESIFVGKERQHFC